MLSSLCLLRRFGHPLLCSTSASPRLSHSSFMCHSAKLQIDVLGASQDAIAVSVAIDLLPTGFEIVLSESRARSRTVVRVIGFNDRHFHYNVIISIGLRRPPKFTSLHEALRPLYWVSCSICSLCLLRLRTCYTFVPHHNANKREMLDDWRPCWSVL